MLVTGCSARECHKGSQPLQGWWMLTKQGCYAQTCPFKVLPDWLWPEVWAEMVKTVAGGINYIFKHVCVCYLLICLFKYVCHISILSSITYHISTHVSFNHPFIYSSVHLSSINLFNYLLLYLLSMTSFTNNFKRYQAKIFFCHNKFVSTDDMTTPRYG